MRDMSRRDFVQAGGLGLAALAAGLPLADFSSVRRRQRSGLLVRGGTLVGPAGRRDADVRTRDGEIVEIGPGLEANGERVIDAAGMLVLPGGIDPHAHLTQSEGTPPQYRYAEDLTSGSKAALAGGITCIGNMTVPGRDQGLAEAIARDEALVAQLAIADIMLHPVVLEPAQLDEAGIRALADAGHTSVKIFMVIRQFDENVREYVRVMRQAGAHGMMSVVHCEDPAIISEATRELVESGRAGLEHYAGSRPVLAEVIATRRAIAYCETTGAPIYVVHLSAAEPLSICREARARGLPVYVETRPIYLHFTLQRYREPDGPLYVGQPPLREAEDIESLWRGLEDGTIQTLGTDHVGWGREQKLNPSLDIEDLRPGVPNLQEMLPVLFSEGVAKGRIPVERFVEITSTNPARLFGLYPGKGTIAVGSDADLVLWAPEERRTIRNDMLLSRAGFSLFEGWEVTGWPHLTIRRGDVVYEEGRITAQPGSGRLLRRGPLQRI